jgi:manganese transport protein
MVHFCSLVALLLKHPGMYRKILVALENSRADESLIPHVAELARRLGSELLLLHVADGWAARNFDQLKLAESEEMKADRAYLAKTAARLRATGLAVTTQLALGNPAKEIVKTADRDGCDLIAMGSHGHRLVGDIILGSAIHEVRHTTKIPVLLIRADRKKS